jgi:RNA polymerase sigma-70 factor (TIGR02943 family)
MKTYALNPKQWVSQYGDKLFSFAYLRLKNREIAEDIVQETLIAALAAIHHFRGECQEKTWLFSILHYKILDYFKKLKKNNFLELNEQFSSYYFDEANQNHWLADKKPKAWQTAQDALETSEFYMVLNACLAKLPDLMSQVFISKYLEDELPAVIQQKFEISSANYWVLLHRSKLSLRACLEKHWFKK